jgi:hypothetical protein
VLYTATISNSSYTGTDVTGGGGDIGTGGLVGYAHDRVLSITNSTVSNGTTRINISSPSAAGGLVGWTRSGVTITNSSVSNANITGGTYVGGLVGEQRRGGVYINNAFAGGSGGTNVTGSNFVGGLVGEMIGGYINNSYFQGTVRGSSNYGGIVGFLKPGAYLSNTFYNVSSSLINGNATMTIGGLSSAQYSAWAASSATVASRSVGAITDYFDLDATDGFYTIASSSVASSSNSITKNDLINVMGFAQGDTSSNANAYKFKLTADINVTAAATKFVPYFSGAALQTDPAGIAWNTQDEADTTVSECSAVFTVRHRTPRASVAA